VEQIVLDAGPFIHLGQIKQLNLLERFSYLHTSLSIIDEISSGVNVPIEKIKKWRNLKIISAK